MNPDRPFWGLFVAHHVRVALVGCAVCGWLAFFLHIILQAILEGA